MNIIKLNAIDSTNSYLKNLSRSVSLKDGTVVIAENQSQGRGQMGAKWQSEPGKSLTFSVFKRFTGLNVSDQPRIAFSVSLAIKNVLQKYDVPAITIKWPNDIMSYQKKLCGILVENQLEGSKVNAAIIGIGLNVNETKFEDLPFATSMKIASETHFDLEEVLYRIYEELQKYLELLEKDKSATLKTAYESALFRKGKVSAFEKVQGLKFNGIIKGVDDSGELIVETEAGLEETFEVKQVKMLF